MSRRPPKATRPDTLVPDTPLVRSTPPARARGAGGPCPRADGAIAALHSIQAQGSGTDGETSARQDNSRQAPRIQAPRIQTPRSEEHTSELQSLMRISYAVSCLNTKNKPLTPIARPTNPTNLT